MALLLREAIGGTIRRARTERRRTLRDVSRDARVSLGYLSEIERGRKEPSSELLAAICDALALTLPELLDDVANSLRPDSLRPETRRAPAHLGGRRLVGVDPALRSAVEEAFEGAGDDAAAATTAEGEPAAPAEPAAHAGASAEVVDLAGDDAPVPAGDAEELRVVELVTVGREPAAAVRSAA
ncbi:helix-turn-helix domain-containing protein [Actinomycetospora sp. TBRC 11914]|uniref:helix-turn-helix domain-containing protein n=1 Tax=Actinomycetospora sp. TBRC 11914 TaxID=2729387 RepID=UPI00145FCBC6|nr:helix-turn-helix transcriptional regulator [Actinomycetospora sp. TBRC 11914]NMO89904.1 helix-turn-helix transcriptional regulator [Actinomycetospora sp. TBRC 11914]